MSIRRRLVLWYGVLLAAVLAAALILAYTLHAESLAADVDAALNDMASRATAEIDAQLASGVPLQQVMLSALHRAIDEPHAAWLVGDGVILAAAGATDDPLLATLDLATFEEGWTTRWSDAGRARVLVAPVASRESRLVLAADLSAIDTANAQLRWAYLVLGLVAVGVGTAAISQVTGAALRPVAELAAAADDIAATRDFGRRVRIAGDPEDELVALGATLDAMLSNLEDAHRRQQRFLGDVSHELRTPLSVIHGNAELLAGGEADLSSQQETASHILRESERLVRLVDKLLALARADTAEPFTGSPVQLDEIVLETFDELRTRAGPRLRLRWLDAAVVRGERDRLKQLLVVLIDNALRYTPSPGIVDVSLRHDGNDAVIGVEDEGIGLPDVPVARLFERSYRGAEATKLDPSGSGLGLAIARWIVLRHGGSISLEPNDGRGTRAIVRIPLSVTVAPQLAAAAPTTTPS